MAGTIGMKQPSKSVSKSRKDRLTDNWREAISATKILKRLEDHGDGKLDNPLDQTQIKAYEVILSRLVPSLSAVEQTTVDAPRSQDEIINDIKALLAANPALLETLLPGYRIIPAISMPTCVENDTSQAQQTTQ